MHHVVLLDFAGGCHENGENYTVMSPIFFLLISKRETTLLDSWDLLRDLKDVKRIHANPMSPCQETVLVGFRVATV